MKISTQSSITFITVFILIITSCESNSKTNSQSNENNTITVFAAASLTDVLSEIVDSFEVNYNTYVTINFASSGTLARQIEQGATADIYISANKRWANYIDSLHLLVADTKQAIANNQLVLIAPKTSTVKIQSIDSNIDLTPILQNDRISMGDPLHVPAGKYAKQSLTYFGWYNDIEKYILPAKDVRSALMVVELEEAPLGIVYKTDALKSEKIKILNSFPVNSHKPIVYMAGLCRNNSMANSFLNYLNSEEMIVIWKKYGFTKN